ncbi:hypothetical protein TNCV_1922171 [Trichonephila clavipes]|nr:hypothetical protein TNCV_1922171 [Trichonephila clavipes]
MSSGCSLPQIHLGVKGGIQGDSHMLMVGTGAALAVSPPRAKSKAKTTTISSARFSAFISDEFPSVNTVSRFYNNLVRRFEEYHLNHKYCLKIGNSCCGY